MSYFHSFCESYTVLLFPLHQIFNTVLFQGDWGWGYGKGTPPGYALACVYMYEFPGSVVHAIAPG